MQVKQAQIVKMTKISQRQHSFQYGRGNDKDETSSTIFKLCEKERCKSEFSDLIDVCYLSSIRSEKIAFASFFVAKYKDNIPVMKISSGS